MNMTQKQAEFWAFVVGLCTVVAIAVLLLDFGIKAAILEESTRLRLKIEEWERGQHAKATTVGTDNDVPEHSSILAPLLVDNAPGMEAGSSDNGDKVTPIRKTNRRRAKPSGPIDPSGVS